MSGIDTSLDGKVAVITGGSKGIGKATAASMAAAGAQVLITSRKADACEEAAAEIGHGCVWRAANVGDDGAAEAVIGAAIDEFGAVDILVNNAGTNPYAGKVIDSDVPRWEKTVQVNVTAPMVWAQQAWHRSMAERGGAIVNVASVGGVLTSAGIGNYNITKAAQMHLTRQLAAELAPGVRVNAVAPGVVKTDLARMLWEGDREQAVAQHYPLKRLGTVDDIANAIHFLASDAAAWITGQVLFIDGGGLIRYEEAL